MPSDRCLSVLSCLSVCNVDVLWPNSWTDQDETWHTGRPRPWPHCVRWGPSSPPPKCGTAPKLRPTTLVAKRLDGSRCHLVSGMPHHVSGINFLILSVNLIPCSPSVSDFPADAPATASYSLNSPLSPSITPSLFHSRLKTYLFHKSFPP